MTPNVYSFRELDGILKFTLSGVNFSFANAIRRNSSSVPTVVFRTFPYKQNTASIRKNTTRFTNEIIKQRLSCIPIHITELSETMLQKLKELELVINVKNESKSISIITTENFVVRYKESGKELECAAIKEIFPPNNLTNHYIDFIRLHPRYSETMKSEELEMTCDFDIGTANEDGMFNVVSTFAYSNTPDEEQINTILESEEHANKSLMEQNNWRLLNSQRIYIEDSFDFIIESVGVFSNKYILLTSITSLREKVVDAIDHNSEIRSGQTTLDNGYTLHLFDDDYTVGKMIEYMLYSNYFNIEESSVNFCAYKKDHPHDAHSCVILGFNVETSQNEVVDIVRKVKEDILKTLNTIYEGVISEWSPTAFPSAPTFPSAEPTFPSAAT